MSLATVSDVYLAGRASRGDAAAFAELARRYRRLLWAASNHPPAGLEPEDLRQEALLGLFRACRRSAALPGLWFPWLARRYVRWAVGQACAKAAARKHQVLTYAERDGDEVWEQLEQRAAAPEGSDPAVVVELRDQLRQHAQAHRAPQAARVPGRRRWFRDDEKAHALQLIADGHTLQQAGHAVGAHADTVGAWVKRAGQQRLAGRHFYTQAEIALALALVDAGVSLAKAGAAVGARDSTVLKWRRKAA
jgi:hypothetical protein